jgi:hypothetical protein
VADALNPQRAREVRPQRKPLAHVARRHREHLGDTGCV